MLNVLIDDVYMCLKYQSSHIINGYSRIFITNLTNQRIISPFQVKSCKYIRTLNIFFLLNDNFILPELHDLK